MPPLPALPCLARTDRQVLNLNLNAVVWKAILSRKVRIVDLELVDETYYRWDNVTFLVRLVYALSHVSFDVQGN